MRLEEREAVTTTIVGGRPPGCGRDVGAVPRGLEVLVKKAAVDAEFKALLLARRAEAAARIGLELNPAEAAMLAAIPAAQLELIIERTEVPEESRRAFLGTVAGAMLAALGLGAVTGCNEQEPGSNVPNKGHMPDRPQVVTLGIQPDSLEDTMGMHIDQNTTEGQTILRNMGMKPNNSPTTTSEKK